MNPIRPALPLAAALLAASRDSTGEYATTARRGHNEWMLRVTGRQAHSSGVFSAGAGSGAIFEAARILTAFHESCVASRT